MDIGRIFSRSLELLWKFKFLLLFGFVMGITGGGGSNFSTNFDFNNFGNTTFSQIPRIEPALVAIGGLLVCVLFIVWLVLFFYFRFVSRGALVSTVRDIEAGSTATLRDSWNSGRKYYTRLLGLGFLVNVPLVLFSILVFVPAILLVIPIVTALARGGGADEFVMSQLVGTFLPAFFAFCCAILCLIVVYVVVHPLYEMAVRAIVVEELAVREGIRRGIGLAREHAGNVIIAYLLLIAARIGWGIAVGIIAIPIGLLFFVPLLGGGPVNWNLLIGILLVAAIPLWLLFGVLEGIFQAFEANVWTEVYLALGKRPEPAIVETT